MIAAHVAHTHKQAQHRVSNKSIEERSARSLPISDKRICSLQRCPDPCESEHLNTGAASEVQGRRRPHRRCWRHWQEHPTWDVGPGGHSWSPSGPIRVVQSPRSCPPACPSELLSLLPNPGAVSVVQGRRWSPRPWSPPHARAPDAGPRWPLMVAIQADSRRSKHAELPARGPERTTQPLAEPRV